MHTGCPTEDAPLVKSVFMDQYCFQIWNWNIRTSNLPYGIAYLRLQCMCVLLFELFGVTVCIFTKKFKIPKKIHIIFKYSEIEKENKFLAPLDVLMLQFQIWKQLIHKDFTRGDVFCGTSTSKVWAIFVLGVEISIVGWIVKLILK